MLLLPLPWPPLQVSVGPGAGSLPEGEGTWRAAPGAVFKVCSLAPAGPTLSACPPCLCRVNTPSSHTTFTHLLFYTSGFRFYPPLLSARVPISRLCVHVPVRPPCPRLTQERSFEGTWRGGLAHGHGTWRAAYDYRLAPAGPAPTPTASRRREEREGRWHRQAPADGEWRLCWADGTGGGEGAGAHERRGQFVGRAARGRPEGEGVCKYPSGGVYTGGWRLGLRSGAGAMVWPSGASFEGEWSSGRVAGLAPQDGESPPS